MSTNIKTDADGNKFWLVNGQLHRDDGPAAEYANGVRRWHLNGKELKCNSQKEFDKIKLAAQPKPKVYYDVRVETQLPATLNFKILAESPEQAFDLIKNAQPNSVNYKLAGRRDSKVSVYDMGSSIIRWIKRLY